jgi:hypothetical protein
MFTLLYGRGHAPTLTHYLPHIGVGAALTPADVIILESNILHDISILIHGGPPYPPVDLNNIAIGIQLWGGNTGRWPFLGPGFVHNFPIHFYSNIIHLMLGNPPAHPILGNWHAMIALLPHFHGFNISFFTKHLSFWSRNLPPGHIKFPILDSLIKKQFIDPHHPPALGDYPHYLDELNADLAILQARPGLATISIQSIERQLFNFILAGAPGWIR